MFVEIHLIQNFSPSNLNRDDTNSPKDCEFGGVRRARISSQCLKRAIRQHFNSQGDFSQEELAIRTRHVAHGIERHVKKLNPSRSSEEVCTVAEKLLAGCKITIKDGLSQYLLFLGELEFSKLAEILERNFDTLLAIKTGEEEGENKKKSSKDAKKGKEKSIPKDLVEATKSILDGGKAVDLALFGRMIANLPENSREASCQVAHAISTHRVAMESDYFTAIDDLQTKDSAGAGMLGTVDFNSSCFYRYAVVDMRQLEKNLHGDKELAMRALEGFTNGMIHAIPTGKQNSMAAHNPPSAIMFVARKSGQWSLANAFESPVRASFNSSLVHSSIVGMCDYFGHLASMYGTESIKLAQLCCMDKEVWVHLKDRKDITKAGNLAEAIKSLMATISRG